MTTLKALLLRDVKNPIVRSAIINCALTVAVAGADVLDAQLHNGHVNVSLIVGAVSLAFSKWVHSTITDVVARTATVTPEPVNGSN